MTSSSTQDQRAATPVVRTLIDTAEILRQAGDAEAGLNAHRGEIGRQLAVLVALCAHHHDGLPPAVADQALRVAAAVDQATGQRRVRAS